MPPPLVTFRCDGSLQVGGGHIMRCLTLADIFVEEGFDCRFITNVGAPSVIPAISKFDVIEDDRFQPDQTDIVVIDNYALDASYEGLWRGHSNIIAVIDDLANREHDCDVLIDQTFQRDPSDYEPFLKNDAAISLCGSQYAILRSQFSACRAESINRRKELRKVERVIISFGSTNPSSLTQRALKDLCAFKDWPLRLDVVMGAQAQGQNEVAAMIRNSGMHNAKLYINVSNMGELMASADLAIGAGGTTSWERCCLGLPTLLIELADNQTLISENLDKVGAVKYSGKHQSLEDGDILNAFYDIHETPERLKIMSQHAADICDGQGGQRIVNRIKGLL